MQIRYQKGVGVILVFPNEEMQAVLQILKAMYKVTQYHFIGQAISDIEADLQPKKLPVVNHFHLCHHCCRELDDRDPNSFLMTTLNLKGGQEAKWIHYQCKPLKPDSQRER
jgi:hypothetical protein